MPSDFSSQGIALEDEPDFSGQGEALESTRSEYDYLPPLPPITKRRQLEIEQVEARNELSPITELLAADQPLVPPPSPSESAQLMSPIGFQVRPFRQPSGPVSEAVFEAGRTVAEMPFDVTRPTMLPLAPLATVPIPGAPVIRHAIPKAMGLLFGGQSLGQGAADIVTGVEEEDPKLIGRGIGETVIGGALAAHPVAEAGKPLLLPRSLEALRQEPGIEFPEFVQAKVQPGERAGFAEQQIRTTEEVPSASEISKTTAMGGDVSAQPVEGAREMPVEEGRTGVQPRAETQASEVLLDPVGNTPEFYSLPRLRALDRSKDPRLAAAKKYYGAKTVPDLARLAKARFDEMAAKAKPLETREDAEMKRVQALPEGPEGEAQLVAEDIAKAVETVNVDDVAGVSPVLALVRIIRRAARDSAMKTAAEQAMQKIGAAAREQDVPLDAIKQEIAGELKAIYGADAPEMAKAYFGEEPKPTAPLTQAELSAIEAKLSRREKLTANEESRLKQAQEASDASRTTSLEAAISALPPEQRALVRSSQAAVLAQQEPAAPASEVPATPAPVAAAKAQAEVSSKPQAMAKRIAKAPLEMNYAGWDIVKDGDVWVLRHPTQKTEVYRGSLLKVREHALRSPLDGSKPTPPESPIPPGPGAASPSEFAERTARGAGAEPPKGPPQVTIDANAKPTPEVARKAKDFNLFNKANSGQWTFYFGKLGEAAKSAWDKMTLSAFKIREDVGRDTQRYVDNLLAELPREIRRKGGKVFFDALDGKDMAAIEAEWTGKSHGDAVIAAARQVKARLEEIRTTIRDTKRESYNAFLMGLDRSTLAELFDNNISRSIDTSKYTKEQFSDALTRNEFPDDWGIADGSYLTHLFTGTWKVTAKLGETTEFVTRAKTVAEAKAQIFKRVKENPDYANADWKIEQDTVIPADMIRLGDRRFWNLVQRMKDNLGVTASEVKQAQQGIIGRKASKQKWFGSLQQRRGFQGYSHDFRQTMTSYLSGFHRWLELTKLNREVQPLIEQVRREGRTSAAEQLDILMENLWGKPPKSTVLFDNFIREIPGVRDYVKPLALDRWSRNIRSTLAFLTLRTARFAVVNRLQPLQGLYPLVGERILAQAKIRQHTAEGRALLDEAGVRFDPGQYGSEASGVKGTFKKIGERLSGERSNQELAFLAMFQHGTESGLSRAEAINYAKLRGQLLTQFTPVITDIPPIMRGPFTSLLFQFKRFPIKQAELLFKMVAKRQFGGIARWLGVMAAAGGLSYFMRQFLIAPDKRDRLRRNITDQHGQWVADAVMYGLPGLVNTDISGSLVLGDEPFGSNIYEKIGRQVTGPAASMAYENIKAALTEPRESTTETQKAVDTLRKIPTLRPIAELIALEQSDLDVRTPDGETKYRKAVRDALVNIGSFRTATESNNQMAINGIVELEKQSKSLKNAAYVALTTEGGNGDAALEAIQKFNERWPEVAITGKELKEYIQDRVKGKGKTDYERLAGKKFAPLLPEQP